MEKQQRNTTTQRKDIEKQVHQLDQGRVAQKNKDNVQSELQRKKQQRLNKETNQKKGEKPTNNIVENKEK